MSPALSLLERDEPSGGSISKRSSACTAFMVYLNISIRHGCTTNSSRIYSRSSFLTNFPPQGPVVRINPYEIHVKYLDWYDELYTSSNRRRDKSEWFVGRSGGNSIFGTIRPEHHRLRRSALNPFFSKRSIVGIEPLIQDKVNKLCNTVERYIQSGKSPLFRLPPPPPPPPLFLPKHPKLPHSIPRAPISFI